MVLFPTPPTPTGGAARPSAWQLRTAGVYSAVALQAVMVGHFTLGLQSNYLGRMDVPGTTPGLLFVLLMQLGYAIGCLAGVFSLHAAHHVLSSVGTVVFACAVVLEWMLPRLGICAYTVAQVVQGAALGLVGRAAHVYLRDIAIAPLDRMVGPATSVCGAAAVLAGKWVLLQLLGGQQWCSVLLFQGCLACKLGALVMQCASMWAIPPLPYTVPVGPQLVGVVRWLYPHLTRAQQRAVLEGICRAEGLVWVEQQTLYRPPERFNPRTRLVLTLLLTVISCRVFSFRNADLFASIGVEEQFGLMVFSLAVLGGAVVLMAATAVCVALRVLCLASLGLLLAMLGAAGVVALQDRTLADSSLTKTYTYLLMAFLAAILTFSVNAGGVTPGPASRTASTVLLLACSALSWTATFLVLVLFNTVAEVMGVHAIWTVLVAMACAFGMVLRYGRDRGT